MLTDYSPLLSICLAFLAATPKHRAALLPDVWERPVMLDNGYAFCAEQPRMVMADFCQQWLCLQESWEELPTYTALALAPLPQQAQFEAQLCAMAERVHRLPWREWAEADTDCGAAQAWLQLMQWPATLSRPELHEALDAHTYGTFSLALANPAHWEATSTHDITNRPQP